MTRSTPASGSSDISVEVQDDSVGTPVGEIDIPPVESDGAGANDDR